MKLATICFCIRDNEVLLAPKKRKIGVGLLNGYGGKIEGDETPSGAAIRELRHESSLVAFPNDLDKVAIIEFLYDGQPKFKCHIFIARLWQGEPVETEEMGPPEWHLLSRLPYDRMMPADGYWVPVVLISRLRINGQVFYNAEGTAVNEFRFQPLAP
jgi:8-oxo-dGTP diphosphatase